MGLSGQEVNWLDLPNPLPYLIADRLNHQKDFICFGASCKAWQSVYKDIQHSRAPKLPLLMLVTELNQDDQTRSFYSLTDQSVCSSQVPVPHNRVCRGSSHGWLVTFTKDFQVHLVNPFLSVDNEICLPSLRRLGCGERNEGHNHGFFLKKAILSANPSLNPNYAVMVIYGVCCTLAYFRPGDSDWTSLDSHYRHVRDLIYYRDQYYFVNGKGVFSCDLDHARPRFSRIAPSPVVLPDKRYLVESSGDLLQITRSTMVRRDDVGSRKYYDVALDVFKLDSTECKWTELDKLEGCLLFLGDNHSLSVRASNFPQCKRNCIYFTDDVYDVNLHEQEYGTGFHDMGVYSVDDSTVEPHYPAESKLIYPAPIWVQPSQ